MKFLVGLNLALAAIDFTFFYLTGDPVILGWGILALIVAYLTYLNNLDPMPAKARAKRD